MPNTIYDNFFLSNEVEDQFNSLLDLNRFVTVDRSLSGTAGMLRKINVYRATDGTEKLTMGNGNTRTIEVSYGTREYRIQLAQNRFKYFDEEAMTDPMIVPTGVRHAGVDIYNTVNDDIYGEYANATMVTVGTKFDFDIFANAQSMLNLENLENTYMFAFVHPTDVAALRKELKDSLQYVEAFVRTGYVGTVAGVNIFTKKDATPGTIYMATAEAVTMFVKTGTEVEQIVEGTRSETAANIRENTIYTRKYYLAALTDETKVVKMMKGTASVTTDQTVTSGKTYYAASGLGYVKVTPESTDNPATEGWYEIA